MYMDCLFKLLPNCHGRIDGINTIASQHKPNIVLMEYLQTDKVGVEYEVCASITLVIKQSFTDVFQAGGCNSTPYKVLCCLNSHK